MVPNLTTALAGPLLALEQRFLDQTTAIERWFRCAWQDHTPPFYASVDLRNAGFKLAPVDTNLFPGGFNNLNPAFYPLCIQAIQTAIEKYCPDARNMLLIPENHTRNQFYLKNVATLAGVLRQAGLNVRLASVSPEVTAPTTLELDDGQSLYLEPLQVRDTPNGRRWGVDGFDPCMVLLNNDLSAGVPDILRAPTGQTLIPPVHAGWHVRRKSQHFAAYDKVAHEFASLVDIDAWRINPYFATCDDINFQERVGEACLAARVDELLSRIRAKYRDYEIDREPYVVVKADAGTYGMGVMTVRDASEVMGLNRKQRNKMSVIKEGMEVSSVIIQEGVPTLETIGEAVAEPVVYMMDRFVVGGFYRVHEARGVDENLNAPGMHFVPLAFETGCNLPDYAANPDAPPNRFYAYGVIARLALMAASLELEATDPFGV
jgi:glutamate--cysteine ligase